MHNFLALPTLSGYRCRAFTSSDTAQIVSFQLDAALSIHNALQHRYDAFAISHPSDGTAIVNRSLVNFEPNNHCSKTTHYTAYYDTLLNQGRGRSSRSLQPRLAPGCPSATGGQSNAPVLLSRPCGYNLTHELCVRRLNIHIAALEHKVLPARRRGGFRFRGHQTQAAAITIDDIGLVPVAIGDLAAIRRPLRVFGLLMITGR